MFAWVLKTPLLLFVNSSNMLLNISSLNHLIYESTKLRALRTHMPTYLTCLSAYVPTCLACLRHHVLTCFAYLRAHVPNKVPYVLTCSRANVPCVLMCSRALRASGLTSFARLCAHVFTCQIP